MGRFEELILKGLGQRDYVPMRRSALCGKLGVRDEDKEDFVGDLKELVKQGRVVVGVRLEQKLVEGVEIIFSGERIFANFHHKFIADGGQQLVGTEAGVDDQGYIGGRLELFQKKTAESV